MSGKAGAVLFHLARALSDDQWFDGFAPGHQRNSVTLPARLEELYWCAIRFVDFNHDCLRKKRKSLILCFNIFFNWCGEILLRMNWKQLVVWKCWRDTAFNTLWPGPLFACDHAVYVWSCVYVCLCVYVRRRAFNMLGVLESNAHIALQQIWWVIASRSGVNAWQRNRRSAAKRSPWTNVYVGNCGSNGKWHKLSATMISW